MYHYIKELTFIEAIPQIGILYFVWWEVSVLISVVWRNGILCENHDYMTDDVRGPPLPGHQDIDHKKKTKIMSNVIFLLPKVYFNQIDH